MTTPPATTVLLAVGGGEAKWLFEHQLEAGSPDPDQLSPVQFPLSTHVGQERDGLDGAGFADGAGEHQEVAVVLGRDVLRVGHQPLSILQACRNPQLGGPLQDGRTA